MAICNEMNQDLESVVIRDKIKNQIETYIDNEYKLKKYISFSKIFFLSTIDLSFSNFFFNL